jgi:hypothetical protein
MCDDRYVEKKRAFINETPFSSKQYVFLRKKYIFRADENFEFEVYSSPFACSERSVSCVVVVFVVWLGEYTRRGEELGLHK